VGLKAVSDAQHRNRRSRQAASHAHVRVFAPSNSVMKRLSDAGTNTPSQCCTLSSTLQAFCNRKQRHGKDVV